MLCCSLFKCKLPDEPLNASYHLNTSTIKQYYPWDTINNKSSSCEIIINNKTEVCEKYIFDEDVYGYTSVIEYELTCKNAYLIATSNALFMVGVMVGSIGFGEMSDRYGRKITFVISLVVQLIFGVIAGFAPEYWTFTIARAIVGATTSGVFLVAYVIGLEMVGPSKRTIAGTVSQMFFSVGYMLTAVFALYIYDWRILQFALTIPGVLFLCYWWCIPESARWLISKNRITEAKKLIQIAAKHNKVTISDDTLNSLLVSAESQKKAEDPNTKSATVLDIFKHSSLRKRALIIFFDWFANNITYYGLSWNTNNLAGNPYLNFVVSGAVEIPAYIFVILTLNRWGRKKIMCGCMILAGTALLLTMAVPKGHQWLVVTLAMIGKLAITASYGTVYIFSIEQFPTVIRNAGLGAGSTCARLGSIIAPYINLMTHIWVHLPLLIFGSLAFIGGILSLALPETLNRKLPETMAEGEAFGRKEETGKSNASEPLRSVAVNDTEKLAVDAGNENNEAEIKLLQNGPS
ncbi:hypothetical protein NQ315_004217 [Exocentrus adspersus]|uniref:Major facilitator superfamily (MFS) profile domain-containing protein n=1 Tax=Exocentrus adspersus TaxID=1586481 RepID=A0AAV8W737_9CUCU|nr:hypothetical protein NQ315_004217 [Exocentrus adspersus]